MKTAQARQILQTIIGKNKIVVGRYTNPARYQMENYWVRIAAIDITEDLENCLSEVIQKNDLLNDAFRIYFTATQFFVFVSHTKAEAIKALCTPQATEQTPEEEEEEEAAETVALPENITFAKTETPEDQQFWKPDYYGRKNYNNGYITYIWGSYHYGARCREGLVYCGEVVIAKNVESAQDAYELCAEHFANWEYSAPNSNPTPAEPIDVRAHWSFSDPIMLAIPQPEAEAETAPAETVGNPEDEPTPIDPYLAECTPSIEDFPETAQPWGIEFLTNSQTASYNRGEYAYTWGAYSFTENLAGGEVVFLNPQTQEQTVIIKDVQSVVGAYGIAKAHWLDRQNPPKHIKGLNDLPTPESIADFDQYKIPAIAEGVETYTFKCGLGAFYMLSLPTTPLSLANIINPNLCAHLRYPNGLETTLPFHEQNTVLDFYRTIYHDWTHGAKSEYKPEFKHISDTACAPVQAPPAETAEYSEQATQAKPQERCGSIYSPESFPKSSAGASKLLTHLKYLINSAEGGIYHNAHTGKRWKIYTDAADIEQVATFSVQSQETGLYPCKITGIAKKVIFSFYKIVYDCLSRGF